MKRSIIVCSVIVFWTLVHIASCNRHKLVAHGFVNDPQDSILFDLKDYVLPASEVDLWNVVKSDGYYYFCFHEQIKWGGSHSFLMAATEDKLHASYIPLPDHVRSFSSIFVRNDSLMIKSNENQLYSFDPKKWSWSPSAPDKNEEGTQYEDDDWAVLHSDHGEFGEATWFKDKQSGEEYAFVGLQGSIRRIGTTFYVVNDSRIYELTDPSIGFHCDSSTRYYQAKDTRLIASHFYKAGYSPLDYTFSPIIHLDNESAEMERHEDDHGFVWYDGGFGLSDFAKADTVIVSSFIASDSLFCALNTLSGLELSKLDDGHLTTVHRFDKDAGGSYLRVRFPDTYPSLVSTFKYKEKSLSSDEKLLLLLIVGPGTSELIDIAHNGNSVLKLCYTPGGLSPVEQDGFNNLLSYYLRNWESLTLDEVLRKEKQFGGEISYLNMNADRNSFPPKEIFSENEKYHIDIVSKQISESYKVETSYWVQESNNAIPAIYLKWSSMRYNSSFDPKAKHEELERVIDDSVGPGKLFPQTGNKMMFTEWQTGQRTIRLYRNSYDVRFIIF